MAVVPTPKWEEAEVEVKVAAAERTGTEVGVAQEEAPRTGCVLVGQSEGPETRLQGVHSDSGLEVESPGKAAHPLQLPHLNS